MKTNSILLIFFLTLAFQLSGSITEAKPYLSDMSAPLSTMKPMPPPNLLLNPGAEDGLLHWNIEQGVAESMEAFDCNGSAPYNGDYYFAVGGLCEVSNVPGVLTQVIDISVYADSIQTGEFQVNFGGYMSNYAGEDLPEMRLYYVNDMDDLIGFSAPVSSLNVDWTLVSATELLPQGTSTIRVELKGTWNAGSVNDCYFDDLYVFLGTGELDPEVSIEELSNTPKLMTVTPNPVQSFGVIEIPISNNGAVRFSLLDATGSRVSCDVEYFSDRIIIHRGRDLDGMYLFTITNNGGLIGRGKVLFRP